MIHVDRELTAGLFRRIEFLGGMDHVKNNKYRQGACGDRTVFTGHKLRKFAVYVRANTP